jgi:hypothetical protein
VAGERRVDADTGFGPIEARVLHQQVIAVWGMLKRLDALLTSDGEVS